MPPVNGWHVERSVATSNWRPEPTLHLPLLLRLSKAVGGGVGAGEGKQTTTRVLAARAQSQRVQE
jgi:hypothetical protein